MMIDRNHLIKINRQTRIKKVSIRPSLTVAGRWFFLDGGAILFATLQKNAQYEGPKCGKSELPPSQKLFRAENRQSMAAMHTFDAFGRWHNPPMLATTNTNKTLFFNCVQFTRRITFYQWEIVTGKALTRVIMP